MAFKPSALQKFVKSFSFNFDNISINSFCSTGLTVSVSKNSADDWLFFEKITFAVDEERYYKYFSYYDVVRDNEYGDIWETGDIEVGESELEILRAIADSEKTIVRFEGDEYYDDIVISASDKQAIKEMLQIYEALK